MGETILTGFIGAVLALYLNYYYDQHKEKKELEIIRLSLLDIFLVNILPSLKILSINHQTVKDKIENEKITFILPHNLIHFLDIDFQNYLDKNKVLTVLDNKSIKSSLLYNIHKNLLLLQKNNARSIIINFQIEENLITDNYNNKISNLYLSESTSKYSELKFESDKRNFEMERLNTKTMSELDTSNKILDLTIDMVNEMILSLK